MEIEFLLAKSYVTARHNIHGVSARPVVLHPGDADFGGDVLRLPLYMAMLLPDLD